MPVSYTHLVAPTVWREIEGMGIPGIASEVTYQRDYPAGETSAPIVGFVTSSEAVSYTHLDVYKRQVDEWAATARNP